jgi:hypothetical protein
MKEILKDNFDYLEQYTKPIKFIIKMTENRFEYTFSEMTVWIKKKV